MFANTIRISLLMGNWRQKRQNLYVLDSVVVKKPSKAREPSWFSFQSHHRDIGDRKKGHISSFAEKHAHDPQLLVRMAREEGHWSKRLRRGFAPWLSLPLQVLLPGFCGLECAGRYF
jgi:hypothetical protein